MKILNLGSCNIDYVYSLDHIVNKGETETTFRLDIFPGGKGLNQSIAASKAGAKVFHAGCIGADSEILTDILSESGVDISYLEKTNDKNGHAIIQVDKNGSNSIFLFPGTNDAITKEYVDSVLEHFNNGDIILLQNEINNVGYIVDKAYQKNMCIILNPSPFNEKLKEIDFDKLTYLMLNEFEAKEIAESDSTENSLTLIKKKYPNTKIILTLGCEGAIYADGNQEIYHPAFEVKAIDTTAAGDTFTGYFAALLSKGLDPREILKTASAAAAISVTKNGAAPSIPCINEVMSTINSMKLYD